MSSPVIPEHIRAAIHAGHVALVVVFCDRCGVEDEGDYTGETKEVRLAAARRHLGGQGWLCNADGDLCPNCRPATGPAPHILVVTQTCDPHPGEPHEVDCYDRSIECPGLTPACQMWMPCPEGECKARPEPDGYEDGDFHGVYHRHFRLDGFWWGIPEPQSCFYRDADGTSDATWGLVPAGETGRYPVDVEADDANPVFHLIEEPSNV